MDKWEPILWIILAGAGYLAFSLGLDLLRTRKKKP